MDRAGAVSGVRSAGSAGAGAGGGCAERGAWLAICSLSKIDRSPPVRIRSTGMLFPSNQALFYIGRLREVEVLSEFADSEYAKEMIRQLIAFFESGQELTKYGHDSESYNRAARIV